MSRKGRQPGGIHDRVLSTPVLPTFTKARNYLGCRHIEVKHQQVPHPRYGTKVAHFVSWEEETECTCVGKLINEELERIGAWR